MSKGTAAVVMIAGLLSAGGCHRASNAPVPTASSAPTINASMTKVMSVQAQTIWDITSAAFNERGDGLVASKITPKQWVEVGQAAQALRDRARLLANARPVVVVAPGETIMGEEAVGEPSTIGHTWDAASPQQVQARIDANPTLFSQRARILADSADLMLKAAQTHDAKTLYDQSAGLDDVCDGCHERFWGTDEPPPPPK